MRAHGVRVGGHEGGEDGAEVRGNVVGGGDGGDEGVRCGADDGAKFGDAREVRGELGGGDERAQSLELGHGQGHLGLVVGVLVHVGAVGVKLPRERLVGMGLDGERLGDGQDLGEEGEIVAETLDHLNTEVLDGVGGDGLAEALPGAPHRGRTAGVRPHQSSAYGLVGSEATPVLSSPRADTSEVPLMPQS